MQLTVYEYLYSIVSIYLISVKRKQPFTAAVNYIIKRYYLGNSMISIGTPVSGLML
jgi:hypothetical protein